MNILPNLPLQDQRQTIAFSFWSKEFTANELVVTAFAVEEAIFGMTRIEVMLSSANPAIALEALMDVPATLTVHHKHLDLLRHFSGIVVEAERGDSGYHRTAYRVVMMPSLYRLDQGSDCRIFQQKSVPEIVKTVFFEHGIQDIKWMLFQNHLVREYATAYRETHLAFVERILAEEGIFYYFEHEKEGRHMLVLSDMPQVLHDCPGQKELLYNALASGTVDEVYCSSLNFRKKLRTTSYVQRDYTFKNFANLQQHKSRALSLVGEKHNYEMYDYPGRFKQAEAGEPFTRYKLEATRVDASLAYGIANTPLLLSGHGVTLTEHPDKQLNQKWRLLTIRHEGVQPQAAAEDAHGAAPGSTRFVAPGLAGTTLAGLSFGVTNSQSPGLLHSALGRGLDLALQQARSDDGAEQNACLYACAFTAMPSVQPYRPPQAVKPLVDGPQVAIVVGPQGEEIHTDIYGRVKVHFPWDRHKLPEAEDSSCWIRVSQPWGGGGYGIMAIPRVGHEVIVEFLEGDPDQPIIMGRTYYAVNMPPYELPANKTKMVIRSNTHKGQGFNELSFEDNTGAEKIYLHGQKDQEILINNDRSKSIGRDQTASIGRDLAESVGRDMLQNVARDLTASIGENLASNIGRNLTSSIGRDLTESVGNDKNMSVGGDLSKAVSKNMVRRVALADTEEIGTDKNTVVGASHISVTGSDRVESVGSNYNVTAGREINLSAAQEIFSHSRTITLFADQELKFMAPGGMILIDSKGVTIDAEKIELKSNAIDMNKKNSKASCFKSSAPTIQMGRK